MSLTNYRKYFTPAVREAERRAKERINTMREITMREHEEREYAYRFVRQMEVEQRRKHVYSDLSHRFLFETALKHVLGQFFHKSPACIEWVGNREQIICLASRSDIPVRDQHEIIRRISIDKFLGCAMLSHVTWAFPRFEIDLNVETGSATTTKPTDPDLRRKSIFEK